ncbi:MAG: MSCRAMM family protein, partial [Wohlfahrtiimonas sp.]
GKVVEAITMVDRYADQTVKVVKTDINNQPLAGAELSAIKQDGSVVERWTSEAAPKELKLQPGTYTLKENKAPNGYVTAADITFTVNIDGTVNVDGKVVEAITMVDRYADQTVKVVKTDINNQPLTGAELSVIKQDGSVVESWTSEATPKEFKLQPGTYTLKEIKAPNGYVTAADITLTVNIDGTVTVDGKVVEAITMVDRYADQTVKVVKTDINNQPLAGAELSVIKQDGSIVESWTSEAAPKELKLQPGTYTLKEIKAPNGYVTAADIAFTVNIDGTVTVDGKVVEAITMIDLQVENEKPVVKPEIKEEPKVETKTEPTPDYELPDTGTRLSRGTFGLEGVFLFGLLVVGYRLRKSE